MPVLTVPATSSTAEDMGKINIYVILRCPLDFRFSILYGTIQDSANIFSLRITDEQAPVDDAAVGVVIYKPDQRRVALPLTALQHVGGGVYEIVTGPGVLANSGRNYSAQFTVNRGSSVYMPKYYFNID